MQQSIQSAEVIKLGKTIVEELNLQHGVDTLSKWMAHYLAEIINKAEKTKIEKERKELQKECVDVILKIWKRKEAIPVSINPISNIKETILILKSFEKDENPFWGFRFENKSKVDSLNMFARKINDLGYQILQITLTFSLANSKFSKTKQWKKEHKTLLSNDESSLIDKLDFYLDQSDIKFFNTKGGTSIKDLSPKQRKNKVLKKINDLIQEQNRALTELEKSF